LELKIEKKNQLFRYENEVYFSISISAFFKSSFGTSSTATGFQVYFNKKFGLDTIQKPSKYFHHHESSPNNLKKWLEFKIEKNQLFCYENEVYFSNSISVFLNSAFGTSSSGTGFQVYFNKKSGFDTIQKPSKYFHHHESSPNNLKKWLEFKIEKNQLFCYENEVYFSNSISVFLNSAFGTSSSGTGFQVYFN